MIKDSLERLRQWYWRLNRRERYFVLTAGAAVLVLLLLQFLVFPVTDKKRALSQQLVEKRADLKEMAVLQNECRRLRRRAAADNVGGGARPAGFTLFSFLDNLAGEAGVKDKITYMKPSTAESANGAYTLSIVEVKLEAVGLQDLPTYLYKIETSDKAVFIKRLSISRNEGDQAGVDAVMQVETRQTI